MRSGTPERSVRVAVVSSFVAALLVLLAGGLVLQQGGASGTGPSHDVPGVATGVDHTAPDGATHLMAYVEVLDPAEAAPAASEHLDTLALGLFLVSLGMLLGVGLVVFCARCRLLELLRLPSILPVKPTRAPLSALEVFRL